jgi:predicted Zn-dependent protease
VGVIGLGGGTFIVYNIETVPVSGRKRFNWVSPENEKQLAEQQYNQVLQQFRGTILPARDPRVKLVQKTLRRLLPASGLENEDWEVHVIEDPMANAFVIPGGKVFVFTGILPICGGEDGLATVLGHEIAHNVAHHSAENMSRLSLLIPFAQLASLLFDVPGGWSWMLLDYALNRPGSRTQETEADFIGLMMMAQSCYDPEEAVHLWERMEKAEQARIPQFMSTHPSNHNRIAKITEWLPRAEAKRDESQCGQGMMESIGSFQKVFREQIQPQKADGDDFW